ncbi:arginase family protein [Halobacteriovorax sp.]|uniref:arginase family protein n=1 Tax=Halobacteriovorax sp. TaxID=2020862 RepID=UPI003AF24287
MNKEESLLNDYLCPPGFGVFTVNTAKERKDKLTQSLFQSIEPQEIEAKWRKSLEDLSEKKGCAILGVASDCGGGIQRGANWGPLFLRNTLLEDHIELYKSCFDLGDIRVIPHLLHDKYLNDETIKSAQRALYQGKELKVSPLSIAKASIDEVFKYNQNLKVFSIGGDHSVSFPLVKAWINNRRSLGKKVGLIHFDAHTDLLRERLGIDYCFGSWLTHVLDDLESPSHCYQYGIRSTGKSKEHWESEFGINQYWAKDVKEIGAKELALRSIKELKEQGIEEIYISFDIDALDESVASATGTPEPEGLMPHECATMIKELTSAFSLTGADMVEIAPLVGLSEQGSKTTLEVGAAMSALMIEAMTNANN